MNMKEILEKYKDCNKFSLTGWAYINDLDYYNALKEDKEYHFNKLKEKYENKGLLELFNIYYQNITTDCENGLTYEEMKDKYPEIDDGLLFNTYMPISIGVMNEIRKRNNHYDKNKSYEDYLPKVLLDNLIEYKVSFHNEVVESADPMINYYFKLNDETKSYLLQYETDFDLDHLQDLALYKDDELKFYSCTHERYNTLVTY